MNDPYKVLGVESTSTDDEVKKAYRALSRKYHPDANIDNPNSELAEEMFEQVQEAYSMLMKHRQTGEPLPTEKGKGPGTDSRGRTYSSTFNTYGGGYTSAFEQASYGATGSSDEYVPDGNDEASVKLRAAANYVIAENWGEALKILNFMPMVQRDARWYFYAARAYAGVGSAATALQYAQTAINMDPQNMKYQDLYRSYKAKGEKYSSGSSIYGGSSSNGSNGGACKN